MPKAKASVEQLAVGIDIGGTGTKFGIVDRLGNLLFSSEMPTRGHAEIETFIDELHKNLSPIIEQAGGVGGSGVLVWAPPTEIIIPALLNMHQTCPGKAYCPWPNW
jgi:glucokinase